MQKLVLAGVNERSSGVYKVVVVDEEGHKEESSATLAVTGMFLWFGVVVVMVGGCVFAVMVGGCVVVVMVGGCVVVVMVGGVWV